MTKIKAIVWMSVLGDYSPPSSQMLWWQSWR